MARHGQRIAMVFPEGLNHRGADERRVFLEERVAEPVSEPRRPVRRGVHRDERQQRNPQVADGMNCRPRTRGEHEPEGGADENSRRFEESKDKGSRHPTGL